MGNVCSGKPSWDLNSSSVNSLISSASVDNHFSYASLTPQPVSSSLDSQYCALTLVNLCIYIIMSCKAPEELPQWKCHFTDTVQTQYRHSTDCNNTTRGRWRAAKVTSLIWTQAAAVSARPWPVTHDILWCPRSSLPVQMLLWLWKRSLLWRHSCSTQCWNKNNDNKCSRTRRAEKRPINGDECGWGSWDIKYLSQTNVFIWSTRQMLTPVFVPHEDEGTSCKHTISS